MNQTNRKRIALVGCLLLLLLGISGCFTQPDPVEVLPTEQPDPLDPFIDPTTPPPLPTDDGWDDPVVTDGGVMPIITAPPSSATTAPTAAPTQAPTQAPTPTTAPTEDSTLRNGSEGDAVRRLQQRLKDLGYYTGSVDGSFGQGTESAVREFQRVNGLSADGVAGQQTLSRLNASSARAKPTPTQDARLATSRPTPKSYTPSTPGVYGYLEVGSSGSAVRNLQQRLKDLGYYSGTVNGSYQDTTEAAVRAFQERNGEWVDGKAGPDTQQALYSSNALPAARGGSSTVPSTGYRTLSAGTDGEDVISLQEKLTEMGFYTGKATGTYDDATQAAVTAFQETNGLEPSGVAGAGTQVRMYSTLSLYATEDAGNIAPPSLETLEMGSTGDDVFRLQERLYDLGYYTDLIDASFDEDVRDAVRAFQRGNSITADGKAGRNTLTKIYSENAKPAASIDDAYATLKEGDTGERVRALQGLLKTYGYLTGDVDGRYRESTTSAVYRLQAQHGLTADGVAGPGTQQLLYLGSPEQARADAAAPDAAGATAAPTYAELRQGADSPDVTMMQQFLEELGYGIDDPSGTFGASTLLAVQAFQEMNDMTPTGIADNAMLHLLYSGLGVPSVSFGYYMPETPQRDTMQEGDMGQDVFTMQERLTMLGYLQDGMTGTFDSATAAAVRQFQQANGLSGDGIAGPETIAAMYATGVIPAAVVQEVAQGFIEVNNTARELSEQSATGAIQASLSGGGVAARYDSSLYYAGKDGKLYRERGGSERLLYDGRASFIHASAAGVTFLSGNKVLRIPLDGGKAQTLASGSRLQKLAVLYNTLYYLDGDTLYKQPVAGEKTPLKAGISDFTIDVFQNTAYVAGPAGIQAVGLNGSGEQVLISSDAKDVQVVDAIVFFRTDGGIWRMEEGVPVQILSGQVSWMAVYRDKLYYIIDGILSRADTDGKNTEIFHDGEAAEVSFASGNVYVTERAGGPVAAVLPVDAEEN